LSLTDEGVQELKTPKFLDVYYRVSKLTDYNIR